VGNTEPMQGDAAALPFPDGMFDMIVTNLGLNNFSDPRAAMRECERVAKPGARLALTTNLQGHMGEFYEVYRLTLLETGREAVVPALEKHIAHRATVDGVKTLFEEAGFRVTAVHEETAEMRFLDGSALLRHHLIKTGFLDAWKELISQNEQAEFFSRLEYNLNRAAEEKGELALTIPMAYIEGMK
jgi:SAM-dependent methyltransferase